MELHAENNEVSWSPVPKLTTLSWLLVSFEELCGAPGPEKYLSQSPGALHLKGKIYWSLILNAAFFLEPLA